MTKLICLLALNVSIICRVAGQEYSPQTTYGFRLCCKLILQDNTEQSAYDFSVHHKSDSFFVLQVFELKTWHPWDTAGASIITFYKHKDSSQRHSIYAVLYLPNEHEGCYTEITIDQLNTELPVLPEDVFFTSFDTDTVPELGVIYRMPAAKGCSGSIFNTYSYKKPYFLHYKDWVVPDPLTMTKTKEIRFDDCDCTCDGVKKMARFNEKNEIIKALLSFQR